MAMLGVLQILRHNNNYYTFFTEANENAELPTCTNPSPSTTAQSHISQVNTFVGVTVGSTVAVMCFMLIVAASVTILLYKNKRNSPKGSVDGTIHAVYSHGHLYQGILCSKCNTHSHT